MAGILYLTMMPFAMFSLGVRFSIPMGGDAAAIAEALASKEGLFRAAIVTWLASQTVFVFLVLTLYRLLRPVNPNRALLMAVLAVAGVPVAFLNELNPFAALLLLDGAGPLSGLPVEQRQAWIPFFLRLHEAGVHIAHVFWGLWLFPFGALVLRSRSLPRLLGVLLIVAGAGYLVDGLTWVMLPDTRVAVTQFTFLGELLLPLWLVVKGVDGPLTAS